MYEEFAGGVDQGGTEFRDERNELGDLVIRVGEGLADRARATADPKALAEAESAVPLHAQVAGESAQAFLTRSRLPSKLAEARAAVKKSQERTRSLAAMDAALTEGAASKVYQARDDLVDQYADLARDRELIGRMTSANELIRKAVKVDTTKRAAARNPRAEPLGPPTSIVLRSRTEPASPAAAPESMVYALVEGFGYGIDAVAGAPLVAGAAGPVVAVRPAGRAGRGRGDRLRRPIQRVVAARCPDRGALLASRAGRTGHRPPAGAGQPARPGRALGEADDDRAGHGRAPGHDEPGPAARPHAGQRRIGASPLRPGAPGHPPDPEPRPAGLRGGGIPGPRRRVDPVLALAAGPVPGRAPERHARRQPLADPGA